MCVSARLASSLIVLAFLCSPSRVCAAAYRCVLDGGQISYQQFPCNSESRKMHLKRQSGGGSALRPGERALLKHYRDRELARRRKTSRTPKKPAVESRACWKKRKQLEAVRARLHRGYRLREADELHRKENDYRDFLRQFCS